MSKRVIIGLAGSMGSGKSTAAAYITEKYGFVEYSFAKPLKDISMIMGFDWHQVYGTQAQKLEVNKMWGITGREFLQKFGTEVCREILPSILPKTNFGFYSIWIRLFEKYCADNPNTNIVVSDVRFSDEANFISSMGGHIIQIDRNVGILASQPTASQPTASQPTASQPTASQPTQNVSTHKSEIPIPARYVNSTIVNNKMVSDLHKNIDAIVELLL